MTTARVFIKLIAMIGMRFTSKKSFLLTLFIVGMLILAVFPSYYFYIKYQKLKNPSAAAKQEVQALVRQVDRLMELPKEEPTVATISDKEKLKDQPFFTKAENGDKVLIFTEGKKAILFRPSINKIIEVAPINIGDSQTAVPSAALPKLKIALYNGTDSAGLTTKIQSSILVKFTNFEVTTRENASKNDYTKTVVVDLTGKNNTQAAELAKILNADIGHLPDSEKKPDADILIIAGADQQ